MKNTTKKTVSRLKRYVGHKIIRIRETHNIEDFSYTDSPLILRGFTSKGGMIIEYPEEEISLAGRRRVLPIEYTDGLWISYRKALKSKNNSLNQWKGKKIRRTCPTKRGDKSYINSESITLVSASKHHIVIEYNDEWLKGKRTVLSYDYADPSEWELAE